MSYARYLSVQTHGGRCCGIKTIWNFPQDPDYIVQPKGVCRPHPDADYYGYSVKKTFDFFVPKRPRETAKERFDAIIEYIKKKRPQGMIEVTLGRWQKEYWGELLESYGFKCVSVFKNSNTSGTTVCVYHLIYG